MKPVAASAARSSSAFILLIRSRPSGSKVGLMRTVPRWHPPLPEGGGFQLLRRLEQQLRFAVHRPGNPVASPRSHGVPRRDVPRRVHVRVAGVTAGSAPEDGLALTRVLVHLPARRAPLAR